MTLSCVQGDSWKSGHAFDHARGRWKLDPTYASNLSLSACMAKGCAQVCSVLLDARICSLPPLSTRTKVRRHCMFRAVFFCLSSCLH